eukprot:Skav227804  [mRNA]  locus=scaffold948:96372:97163:+ [translate_table: standard]
MKQTRPLIGFLSLCLCYVDAFGCLIVSVALVYQRGNAKAPYRMGKLKTPSEIINGGLSAQAKFLTGIKAEQLMNAFTAGKAFVSVENINVDTSATVAIASFEAMMVLSSGAVQLTILMIASLVAVCGTAFLFLNKQSRKGRVRSIQNRFIGAGEGLSTHCYSAGQARGWEQLEAEKHGNGWAFRTAHGTYLSSTPDGQIRTAAARSGWEEFKIEKLDEHYFALKDVHGKFVSIPPQEGLLKTADQIQAWEKLILADFPCLGKD